MRRWIIAAGAVLALTAVARASGPVSALPTLTVYAASDLAFAFRDLVPSFERAAGGRVTLVLGSTGNLAKQIEHGAPADVFFAANETFVDDLLAKGALISDTRTVYAQGRLALATATGVRPKLTTLSQLREPRIRRVAIANPAHAPYGKAAAEALRSAGLWDAVSDKLVYGENIRQALQFVETGAAEAGLVARSIANVPGIEWVAVDPTLHAPLNQAAAVVRRSSQRELGHQFIRLVTGPEGRAVMKRYGFALPGEF